MEQVRLYDTTLRDGMGGQGMSLSVGEKLKVVDALDALGVHFIEAGFPSSNPKEAELFERLAELQLKSATISAFGMTRRAGLAAAEDPALAALVESVAPMVCLVGKSWRLHLEKVIRVSEAENLAMIGDSVAFCRDAGKRVVFDAEHFFDGYRDDPAFALECMRAAAEAGAENVTLCDTNGGSLPGFVGEATAAAVEALDGAVEIGVPARLIREQENQALGVALGQEHRQLVLLGQVGEPLGGHAPHLDFRVAKALAEAIRLRYGDRLSGDDVKTITAGIESRLQGLERLSRVALTNADEPDFVFSVYRGPER